MNTQETAQYYKQSCLQRYFEKKLTVKVNQEDGTVMNYPDRFIKINSAVKPVDEDAENEARRQEKQDGQDEENHHQFLRTAMQTDFGCK